MGKDSQLLGKSFKPKPVYTFTPVVPWPRLAAGSSCRAASATSRLALVVSKLLPLLPLLEHLVLRLVVLPPVYPQRLPSRRHPQLLHSSWPSFTSGLLVC